MSQRELNRPMNRREAQYEAKTRNQTLKRNGYPLRYKAIKTFYHDLSDWEEDYYAGRADCDCRVPKKTECWTVAIVEFQSYK